MLAFTSISQYVFQQAGMSLLCFAFCSNFCNLQHDNYYSVFFLRFLLEYESTTTCEEYHTSIVHYYYYKQQQQTNKQTESTMKDEKKDATIEEAIDKLKPVLSNLSFGCIMGYCSGTALKQVGKALAFVVGIGFIGLQTIAHAGYIQIDWMKVRESAHRTLDTSGDGKFDAEDLKAYWKSFKKIMTNRVPAAGGFSLGFLYGLRS